MAEFVLNLFKKRYKRSEIKTCIKLIQIAVKEPRSPICLFLFGSCFLNEKWLFETLKEDVNHLQIVSGQAEYID